MPARRWFLAGLLAAALASPTLAAADTAAERAEAFVRELTAEGIRLLTDDGLSHAERVDRVRGLMAAYFDVEAIGRWVLGRHWRRASPVERREYLALFEDWVILGYAARFGEYAGETLSVDRSVPLADDTVLVRSHINAPGSAERFVVDWRVRIRDGTLRIVDVAVGGTSMSQTVRSDFGSTVRRGGGDVSALITSLRNKVETLKAEMPAN